MGNPVEAVVRPLDRWQQRTEPVAIVFAIVKKFGDDRGGMLAGLITFYGFLSLFPLLLVGLTLLALVAGPGSHAYVDIRNSTLHHFPVVGSQLPDRGSTAAASASSSGSWDCCGDRSACRRPCSSPSTKPGACPTSTARRSYPGSSAAWCSSGCWGSSSSSARDSPRRIDHRQLTAGGGHGPVVGDRAQRLPVLATFRVLGPAAVGWRGHLPGAVLAGIGWEVLQFLGQYLVRYYVRTMTPVYGQFAVVLGLISFLSLASQLVMYSVEVNAVTKGHLWPRSFVQPLLPPEDRPGGASAGPARRAR